MQKSNLQLICWFFFGSIVVYCGRLTMNNKLYIESVTINVRGKKRKKDETHDFRLMPQRKRRNTNRIRGKIKG